MCIQEKTPWEGAFTKTCLLRDGAPLPGIPVAISDGVRFIDLDSRRTRLLLLGALVLIFGAIAVFVLTAPAPPLPSGPARESSKPPFPSHDVALLPSA